MRHNAHRRSGDDAAERQVGTDPPGGAQRPCVVWSAAAGGEELVDHASRDAAAAGNLHLVLSGPFVQLHEVVAAGALVPVLRPVDAVVLRDFEACSMNGARALVSLSRFFVARSIEYDAPWNANETVSASAEPSISSVTWVIVDLAIANCLHDRD